MQLLTTNFYLSYHTLNSDYKSQSYAPVTIFNKMAAKSKMATEICNKK